MSHVVSERIGGRLIHLIGALEFKVAIHQSKCNLSEANLTEKVIQEVTQFFKPNLLCIGKIEFVLLKFLFDKGHPIEVIESRSALGQVSVSAIETTCENLLKNNILRYNACGHLTWHSRLVENVLIEQYFS